MSRKAKGRSRIKRTLLLFIVLSSLYVGWCLLRPMPEIKPEYVAQQNLRSPATQFAWPKKGQSSVGLLGSSQIENYGPQNKAPIASVAKVITALVVLDKKPLKLGEQGPVITLGPEDEARYKNYQANDGSVTPAAAGEKITEYQMLQAMMLPSANNMSDSLAIWAFGSIEDYTKAANQYLASHGLNDTIVSGDASGLNPATVSTSKDLVKLGNLAMKNPVLASIVGQQTATGIPLTSIVKNVNFLLGNSNIVGIKTGNSDQAGGVFLSASLINPNDKPVTIITSVEQSDNLYSALSTSLSLIKSVQSGFKTITIVNKHQVIARYKIPWGGEIKAITTNELKTKSLAKYEPSYTNNVSSISAKNRAGDKVGSVVLNNSLINKTKIVDIILDSSPTKPSVKWKLTHPI